MQSVAVLVTEKQSHVATVESHERWKTLDEKEEDNSPALLLEELVSPKMLYLDVVQVVSILLIPTLTRFGKEWRRQNPFPSEWGTQNRAYSSEIQRLQGRLGKIRKKDSEEYASVEVGVSEPSLGPREGADSENPFKNETKKDGPKGSLEPKPDGLLEVILRIMWKHIAAQKEATATDGSQEGIEDYGSAPLVNAEMVKFLLMQNGEVERANDSKLVQGMVDAAKSPSGRFDELAFVNALTSDLSDWEVGCEDRISTYVYDVFGTHSLESFHRLESHQDTNPIWSRLATAWVWRRPKRSLAIWMPKIKRSRNRATMTP
jgi:hypothetical protein